MPKLQITRTLFRSAGITAAVVSALGVSAASAHQFTGGNSNTGPSSINRNRHTITTSETIDVVNRALVDNLARIRATTGNNSANNNTTAGGIGGGDVEVVGGFDNRVNTEPLMLTSLGSTEVFGDFYNDTTGPNSSNDNRVNVNSTKRTTIRNDARLRNNVDIRANTGNNSATNNTTVGDVRSGSVYASIFMDNEANTGAASSYLNSGSSQNIDVSGYNDTTGPNSRNTNTVNVNDTTTTRINNTATVNNNLNVNAQTGNNNVSNNTTAGDVDSGDVVIDFTSTNKLN